MTIVNFYFLNLFLNKQLVNCRIVLHFSYSFLKIILKTDSQNTLKTEQSMRILKIEFALLLHKYAQLNVTILHSQFNYHTLPFMPFQYFSKRDHFLHIYLEQKHLLNSSIIKNTLTLFKAFYLLLIHLNQNLQQKKLSLENCA